MYILEKEIAEQPELIMRSYEKMLSYEDDIRKLFSQKRNLFIIGSGSSYHSALFLSSILDRISIFSRPMQASLFTDMLNESNYRNDLVIAFSQSGESSDIIASVKAAKDREFTIASVTNGRENTLSSMSDFRFSYEVGEERAITATKSFIGSLIASLAFRSILSGLNPRIDELSRSVDRLIKMSYDMDMDLSFTKTVFLGSGIYNVAALEGALKLRETAGVDSEGFPFREYEHGYIETLDEKTLVVCIANNPSEKIKRYTSKFLEIETENAYLISGLRDQVLRSIASIIPLQILALRTAIAKGMDPDHPGKLTKVVK